MRFLFDSNLSHRVAQLLCDAGFDAAHVRDKGLQHATDSVILEFARQHRFVLVSEDTDFGELLAQQRTAAPSFVLLRTYEPLTPDEQAAVLLANLLRLSDDLDQGVAALTQLPVREFTTKRLDSGLKSGCSRRSWVELA